MANNTIVDGWQNQPNTRGTFDILKTCMVTIFILCWSSVCPNVPGSNGGRRARFIPKLALFVVSVLGPEWAFGVALGQFYQALQARNSFHSEGYTEWTLRHCFFVNMGGLHIQFRDRQISGLPSFPVDCEQLYHLVQRKYMALPDIDVNDINDRNKTDSLARGITVIQTLWFVIDIFGRIVQGLSITTLELTTLSFVVMMICCSSFWWKKPMDISRPIIILIDAEVSTVRREANAPDTLYGSTPLSFVNRREWIASRLWSNCVHTLSKLKLLPPRPEPGQADCFSSTEIFELPTSWSFILGCLVLAYSSVFMAAWNFAFPTSKERTLWRMSALICVCFNCCIGSIGFYWTCWPTLVKRFHRLARCTCLRKRRTTPQSRKQNANHNTKKPPKVMRPFRRIDNGLHWMRSNSPRNDPALTLPVTLWIAMSILSATYLFSRAFILVEDLISLRALPADAFQTVNWSQYSPIL